MEKEKLLELIHCKLKDKKASFYNLTIDVGLAYMIKKKMIIQVSSKVLYKNIFNFLFPQKGVPYKTQHMLDIKLYEECPLYSSYNKYKSFELSLEEFNEINNLMKIREKEIMEEIITKELKNYK